MSFVWIFLGVAVGLSLVILGSQWFLKIRNTELDRVISGMRDRVVDDENDTIRVKDKTISWVSFYLATDKPWSGHEVVEALMQQGMSLDEDNLFSYKVHGVTWFRAAQATQPVSFDMHRLSDIAITGLAFFMDANEVDFPREAFHKMVGVVRVLADVLNGLLVDQSRHVLSPEDLERIAKQLPKYEDELVV